MSAEYVTDLSYVRRVDTELAPSRHRLVAAMNGFPTPPLEEFTYCELGCGYGDTTTALAAANPRARFFGVDINAEHIAEANRFARERGIENVTFLERDFEALTSDLPELDYVTAHGVLSWVGPAKRAAVLSVVKEKLRPGGLFYASYNAMPGWAGLEPLRQLLLHPTAGIECTTMERARRGLAFAKELDAAGAEYFVANPHAKQMLAVMEREGEAYIAHEYLNAHWVPMYFAQVAYEMAASDLHFVGGLPLYLNYRDLALPSALGKLFANMTDRLTFESLKDFALNEFFRRDIFIKGKVARDAKHTTMYFETTPFGSLGEPIPASREERLPHRVLRYEKPIYDVLVRALQDARTLPELAADPELAPSGIDKVRSALVRLLIGGQAVPFVRKGNTLPTDTKRAKLSSKYNELGLRHSTTTGYAFASPVTGSPVLLPGHEAIALRAVLGAEPGKRTAFLRDFCEGRSFKFRMGDRLIENIAEQVKIFSEQVDLLEKGGLAKLGELGVVDVA